MCSKSNSKTVSQVLFTAFALLVATAWTASTASAQEFFSGRGISPQTNGSSFSNPLAPKFEQPYYHLPPIFKKPAFLENLKMPTLDLKKPNIKLPTLGNLIPQREVGEPTMLGKMKTKTDAFFSKAFTFEKLIPGRQKTESTGGSTEWDSVRKSMEEILAGRGEQNPLRSAGAIGDTFRR